MFLRHNAAPAIQAFTPPNNFWTCALLLHPCTSLGSPQNHSQKFKKVNPSHTKSNPLTTSAGAVSHESQLVVPLHIAACTSPRLMFMAVVTGLLVPSPTVVVIVNVLPISIFGRGLIVVVVVRVTIPVATAAAATTAAGAAPRTAVVVAAAAAATAAAVGAATPVATGAAAAATTTAATATASGIWCLASWRVLILARTGSFLGAVYWRGSDVANTSAPCTTPKTEAPAPSCLHDRRIGTLCAL